MAAMDRIMKIASLYNLNVLEDAAQAFGTRWRGKTCGHHWRYMRVFIFPTKTLGGYGDGGMIVTNIRVIYEKSLCYRVHGASSKYYYDYLGYNSRLDELQAAILNVKLKYIDQSIEKRRKIATLYMEHLRDLPGIRMPTVKWPHQSVYYVFNILADKRDALRNVLKKQYCYSIYYPIPLHLQKCFSYLGCKQGDFPVAESISRQILALPIYPELASDEVEYVCQTIHRFYLL